MKKIFFILILFSSVHSQEPTFTASIERNSISIDERIEVRFSLENAGVRGGENFRPPTFNKFYVLSGPNQSTSMQFVNGNFSSSATYSFIIQPKESGALSIGSASIQSGGKEYKTESISINVVSSGAATPQNKPSQTQPQTSENQNSEIFLRAVVDKQNVFQGEQISVTYKIYTRHRITGYTINKIPAMTGFWEEEIIIPQQITLTTEVINGKQYQVGTIKKSALFATKSGALKINPFEVVCQVQIQNRRKSNDPFDDIFNDPFFGSVTTKNISVKSLPVSINIKPIPTDSKPENYSGLVGNYSVSMKSNSKKVNANEPITLTATINGSGNISLIETPKLELGKDFDKFDPKISTSIDRNSGTINGKKTFEWLIIPRYPGEKKIPKLEIAFFEPNSKKFISKISDEILLSILPSKDGSITSNALINKEDIAILGEDIRFIKNEVASFRKIGEENNSKYFTLILYLFPIAIFTGLFIFISKNEKLKSNVSFYKSSRALKIANKKLVDAKKILDKKSHDEFTVVLSKTIWDYFADKLGINRAELSIEKVSDELLKRGIKNENISELKNILESCDYARFAPSSSKDMEYKKLFESTKLMIASIEEESK